VFQNNVTFYRLSNRHLSNVMTAWAPDKKYALQRDQTTSSLHKQHSHYAIK